MITLDAMSNMTQAQMISYTSKAVAVPQLISLFILIFVIFFIVGMMGISGGKSKGKFIGLWILSLVISLAVLFAFILLPNVILGLLEKITKLFS